MSQVKWTDFLSDYQKLLVEQSQKRKEIMKEIIKSRGVEFKEFSMRKPEKRKPMTSYYKKSTVRPKSQYKITT